MVNLLSFSAVIHHNLAVMIDGHQHIDTLFGKDVG